VGSKQCIIAELDKELRRNLNENYKSLTSGLSQCTIMAIRQSEANSRIIHVGEVETELANILPTLNDRTFCDWLISFVNIAMTYRDDMDGQHVSSIIRHSKVMPEDLAWKWNIGIDTAKWILQVTTQSGI
jgi:hypothetical protein